MSWWFKPKLKGPELCASRGKHRYGKVVHPQKEKYKGLAVQVCSDCLHIRVVK